MKTHTKKSLDEFDEFEEDIIPIDHSLEYIPPPISKQKAAQIKATYKSFTPDVLRIIANVEKKSTLQTEATFDNLYQLLYDPDLLLHALGNIMSKPGSTTKGTDNKSTDKISIKTIDKIAQTIKLQEFKFNPIRRIYISKTTNKKDVNKVAEKLYLENKLTKEKAKELKIRPLGILTTKDKIVAEAIRIILNAIYEPEFKRLELNFGFRPKKNCQDAIKRHITLAKAHSFAIEADITGAFDNVDHDKMIEILGQKIKDLRFLRIIRQGIQTGIFFAGQIEDAKVGTTQGSNVSPLLYNIYFHEFDKFIAYNFTEYVKQLNKEENRVENAIMPIYAKVNKKKSKLNKESYLTKVNETYQKFGKDSIEHKEALENFRSIDKIYKELDKKQKSTERTLPRKKILRFTYTRYADDWILTTNASKSRTEEFKNLFSDWIKENLLLELSESKTKITNLLFNINKIKFLGFNLAYYTRKNKIIRIIGTRKTIKPFRSNRAKTIKVTRTLDINKPRIKRRYATPNLICSVDKQRLLPRLCEARFIKKKGHFYFGRSKPEWTTLQIPEIIIRYNQIIRGYINYFAPCLTYTSELNYLVYLLQYSCLHTLANKANTSISKIINKYGKSPKIVWKPEFTKMENGAKQKMEGKETTTQLISWKQSKNIIENIKKSKQEQNPHTTLDEICAIKFNWRTKFKLTRHCAICGSNNDINYHHVRHIKVGKSEGFLQVMKQLNRKQIPCCINCHRKIHKGEYNGIKLSDLYDERLIIL